MKSTNPIVQNAMAAKEVADLFKFKPWRDPKYEAQVKADLDREIRRIYGDKEVDKWVSILKKAGWYKG